jgi:hypothetical protein
MADGLNLKFTFLRETTYELSHLFVRQTMLGKMKYSGHLKVLFVSLFPLTEFLNMVVVRNVKVMLGQTLNHFV